MTKTHYEVQRRKETIKDEKLDYVWEPVWVVDKDINEGRQTTKFTKEKAFEIFEMYEESFNSIPHRVVVVETKSDILKTSK